MNLHPLSRPELLNSARTAVRNETLSTTVVLYHLREIERRLLHAEMGYESLREFAIKELGYSAGAADRRIAAMRLMREIPELEEKIKEGDLKLSTLCQAQSFFRNEKIKDVEEKKAVLEEIAHLSERQCQRVLAEKRGEVEPPEIRKPLAGGKTLVSHVLEQETEDLLQEIQVELGRTLKMKELVHEIAEIALESLRKRKDARTAKLRKSSKGVSPVTLKTSENADATTSSAGSPVVNAEGRMPRAKVVVMSTAREGSSGDLAKRAQSTSQSTASSMASMSAMTSTPGPLSISTSMPVSTPESEPTLAPWSACVIEPNSAPIRPVLRRAVWRRDQGRCQYRDPVTNKQCECRRYLEVEHIIARAFGGENSLENLQLLCRTHNQFRAVQTFGRKHMGKFHPAFH